MQHFKIFTKENVLSFTRLRKFETKLGEKIQIADTTKSLDTFLAETSCCFILFGIPEDIGVKANQGVGGANTVWTPFLQSFLNIQSNDFFAGEDVLLLGEFDFREMDSVIENNAFSNDEKIEAYRHAVTTIDDEVEHLMKLITEHKKFRWLLVADTTMLIPV